MPIFEYRGLDRGGRNVRGTVDADNIRGARLKLKKDGVYVVDIKDKTKSQKKQVKKSQGVTGKRVNVEDLSAMTRQLATLIKANVPLVDSLSAVAEQVENPTLSEAVADIKNMVNEGSPFHRALSKYPKIFNNIYIYMCEAGEMSGTLDTILVRLAEFTEAQNELNSKVRAAMLYPTVMFVFTMIMLCVLFVAVIPSMVGVFESAEMKLPWYTEVVIGISGILVNYWFVIILLLITGVMTYRSWKNSPTGRPQYDALLLKLPVVGPLARMIAVSRFTRTLSTLLVGGVPMLSALEIVRNVVDNAVLARAIDDAKANISEGESIAGPLKKSGQFPPIVIHMINIGEKTGELETMLTQVSDSYDFQVKTQVQGLTSLMEPVMIVVMGCVIATIVISIMLPIFDMTNMAG